MALLMTDMAAGAQAARQMQQNVIGAQYDQGYADAAAEDTQLKLEGDRLKLQGDRLKAAYAPQQAAAEAEAEKMRLDKMRLARTMEEAQYKSDTDTDARLKAWVATEEGKKATDTEKLRKAAIFKMEGNRVKEGAELLDQAEKQDTRDIANQAKKITAGNEAIAKAFVAVDALDPNDMLKFNAFVDRFPVETTKAITDAVGGPDNWKAYTTQEKKEVLSRLFLNGKGLLADQLKAVELKKTELLIKSREIVQKEVSNSAKAVAEIKTISNEKVADTKADAARDVAIQKGIDDLAKVKQQGEDALAKEKQRGEDALAKQKQRDTDALELQKQKDADAMLRLKEQDASKERMRAAEDAAKERMRAAEDASKERIKNLEDAAKIKIEGMRDETLKAVAEIRAKYESVKAEADKVKAEAETVKAEAAKIRAEAEKTKADKPSTTKAGDELKDLGFYLKRHDAIIREGKKEEDVLVEQVTKADAVLQKAKTASWFNISAPNQDKATNVYTEAVTKLNAFRKKQAEKELAVVEDMPDFDKKASIIKRLQDQILMFDSGVPAPASVPSKTAPAAAVAPATGATASGKVGGATSNKFNTEQQAWFDASKKANPTMSDADIIAEGKKRKKL